MNNVSAELKKIVELESSHFYFTAKRKIITESIKDIYHSGMKVIDLSCSAGVDLKVFENAIGMDYHFDALNFAGKYSDMLINGDANNIPFADNSFDIVLAMDLLSVKSVNIEKTIEEIYRVLKPGGTVLVNLPSLQFMYSQHDISGNNKKRYSRKDVRRMFDKRHWNIKFLTNWTILLMPLVIMQRKVIATIVYDITYSDLITLPSFFNKLLSGIYAFEIIFFRKEIIPFGLSLFARIEKNGNK